MRKRWLLVVFALALLAPIPFVLGSLRVRLAWHVENLVRNTDHDCGPHPLPLEEGNDAAGCGKATCTEASRSFLRHVAHIEPSLMMVHLDDERSTDDRRIVVSTNRWKYDPSSTTVRDEVAAALAAVHGRPDSEDPEWRSVTHPEHDPDAREKLVLRWRAIAEGALPLPSVR